MWSAKRRLLGRGRGGRGGGEVIKLLHRTLSAQRSYGNWIAMATGYMLVAGHCFGQPV